MRSLSLSLLAAAAIGAVSMGSATAMPFGNPASAQDSLVQDVRIVCNQYGQCYNTRRNAARYYAPRAYGAPVYYGDGYGRRGYRGYDSYGYGYQRGPGIGIGVGPVGIGIGAW